MFGRRCSLCNGKLNTNNICKECGLDNSKSEKYYKINQNSCDALPLTHIHEELEREIKPKKKTKSRKSGGGKKKGILSIVLAVMVCGSAIFSFMGALTESYESDPDYGGEEAYDPYEYVDKTHPLEGEYVEYTLTSGDYIVGVHLPEGDYTAEVNDDFDVVQVRDDENGIYLYEYLVKSEDTYLDDLRLFNGAIVSIATQSEIRLCSENAQMQNMGMTQENPAKESYVLEEGIQAVAGKEFEAGVYDIYASSDYAVFYLTYQDEYGETWEYYSGIDIGEGSSHGMTYQNVVILEDAVIYCEEGGIGLVPSDRIGDMDYTMYYW